MGDLDLNELEQLARMRPSFPHEAGTVLALIARIRELEQDAARLDFIERHTEPDRDWHVRVLLTGKGFRLRQERVPGEKTVRAALDAAMAASAKGGKEC